MTSFNKYIKLFDFKFLLFLFLFFVSFIYFLPNLYKEEPVIKIFGDVSFKENYNNIVLHLNNSGMKLKKTIIKNDELIIFFSSYEDQLFYKTDIENYLKKNNYNYSFSLDSYSNIPFFFDYFNIKPVKLGLDLKGGIRFLLEIDYDSVINKNMENYYGNIKNLLKKENLFYMNSICYNDHFEFKFNAVSTMDSSFLYLKNIFPELKIEMNYKKNILLFFFNSLKINDIKNCVTNQSLYCFRKRIDELGLSESIVRKYGEKNIVIELPGLQNIDRARNIIGKTAIINFFMIDDEHVYNPLNKYIPVGSKLLYDRKMNPILLKKNLILSGDFIVSAYSSFNEEKQPSVNVKLSKIGAQNFLNYTSENIGKLMAVVYCESFNDLNQKNNVQIKEEIVSIGKIMQPLYDNFQITGLTLQESNDLSLILRSGSLPTNIFIIEEKVIGPSLGKDNIKKGYNSIIGGLLLILFFMFFYYNMFGIVANICLIFNLIFLISFMSVLDAVLTLPGIAGIVLTLGMSIDANVLIYERIRERILLNENLCDSINNGYKYSFITIIDSNLTTFFVGIILFIIGDGPIKGFAITLCIGIITSLYSSIFGTRVILDIFLKRNIKYLSIGL